LDDINRLNFSTLMQQRLNALLYTCKLYFRRLGRGFDSRLVHHDPLKRIISLRRSPTPGPFAFEAYNREK